MTNEQKALILLDSILLKTLKEDRKPTEVEQIVYDIAQAYLQLLDKVNKI